MQAVVCRRFGSPETLTIEERAPPQPGSGEVLVEIHAAGVNFTDLLTVEGRSQLKRELPLIPGVEAAGVVVKTLTPQFWIAPRMPTGTSMVCSTSSSSALSTTPPGPRFSCCPT